MKKINKFYAPFILMILIFIESSIPMDGGPDNIAFLTNLNPNIQNFLHIPLYGVLAFLWMIFFTTPERGPKRIAFYSLILTTLYGCSDEFHQSFVRGRCGGLSDIYMDIAGAVLGIVIFLKCRKKWN